MPSKPKLIARKVDQGILDELMGVTQKSKDHPDLREDSRICVTEMKQTSTRRTQAGFIPIRKSFVRSNDPDVTPPLAQLYRGGRSNIVAVRLYIALIWRSSHEPFSTQVPAAAWARLLDLDNPDTSGTRRIRAAFKTLETHKLIRIDKVPGHATRITILMENGSGEEYSLPSTDWVMTNKRTEDRMNEHIYLAVSIELWERGYIQHLSGPGLVFLLILLAEQAETKKPWFATQEFADRYTISRATRTRGIKELVSSQLLHVVHESISNAGRVMAERHIRHRYILTRAATSHLKES